MDPTKPLDHSPTPGEEPVNTSPEGLAETLASSQRDSTPGAERYTQLYELGRGGMGRVFAARDQQFRRIVAIKELLTQSPRAKERFSTESIITGNLEHPGIASVYERGTKPDGSPFYAMRMIQGKTLADAIAEKQSLEERLSLLPVLIKVAQTLAFAHSKGVIHRDIKPQNIVLGQHGEAIVLDWGIAKIKGSLHTDEPLGEHKPGGDVSTQYGAAIGTPAYMPPEQAKGLLEKIDERTDVFAVGAILYHLLTGKRPYEGSASNAVQLAASGTRAPIPGAVPKGLIDICNKAMAFSPEDRFKSAEEMAKALESFLARAVLGNESKIERFTVNALLSLMLLFLLAATLVGFFILPSFSVMGGGIIPVLVVSIVGLLLSFLEWKTRGRYHLDGILLLIAIVTIILGFAGTITSVSSSLYHVDHRPDLASLSPEEKVISIRGGLQEAFGNIQAALVFVIPQLVAWGFLRRRTKQQENA